MTPKVTIIKNYRNKETLRTSELQELASMMRSGEYQEQVSEFRHVYPLADFKSRHADGTLDSLPEWTKNLPRICFALEQEHRNHERITKQYNGLVLLEVNNP